VPLTGRRTFEVGDEGFAFDGQVVVDVQEKSPAFG
jgi:hypothetical protein